MLNIENLSFKSDKELFDMAALNMFQSYGGHIKNHPKDNTRAFEVLYSDRLYRKFLEFKTIRAKHETNRCQKCAASILAEDKFCVRCTDKIAALRHEEIIKASDRLTWEEVDKSDIATCYYKAMKMMRKAVHNATTPEEIIEVIRHFYLMIQEFDVVNYQGTRRKEGKFLGSPGLNYEYYVKDKEIVMGQKLEGEDEDEDEESDEFEDDEFAL